MITKTLLAAGLSLALAAVATPAFAGSHDVVVGSNAGAKFWFAQSTGDCEEAAFDTVYGEIKGSRMKESTVIAEAIKLGVLNPNTELGSSWSLLPKLAKHYGIKLTLGSHTTKALEADLKAGDHVIAAVNAEQIWASVPPAQFSKPPPGRVWDFTQIFFPDHALVVDSINETRGTVTLTDSGSMALETVSLSVFRSAWSTSGYQLAVSK